MMVTIHHSIIDIIAFVTTVPGWWWWLLQEYTYDVVSTLVQYSREPDYLVAKMSHKNLADDTRQSHKRILEACCCCCCCCCWCNFDSTVNTVESTVLKCTKLHGTAAVKISVLWPFGKSWRAYLSSSLLAGNITVRRGKGPSGNYKRLQKKLQLKYKIIICPRLNFPSKTEWSISENSVFSTNLKLIGAVCAKRWPIM